MLLETVTLAQARLGLEAVRVLTSELLPMIQSLWVGEREHDAGFQPSSPPAAEG